MYFVVKNKHGPILRLRLIIERALKLVLFTFNSTLNTT